jgi:cathepsin B
LVSGGLYGDHSTCYPYFFPPCAHHTTSTKYPACSGEKPTPKCLTACDPASNLNFLKDKTYAKGVYRIPGAAAMMTEVSTNGPFEVDFSVYEDFLTYSSGVY